jgi:hypothetical protein
MSEETHVIDIFTYHDHFFKIVRIVEPKGSRFELEDEYGTKRTITYPSDLKMVRETCGEILQGYREEMSMPGAKSS